VRIEGETLPEAFFRKVQRDPDRELYFTRRSEQWVPMTFGQGFDFILQTMGGLKHLGFQKGQKICILSENRSEWIMTDYAGQWMGGAVAAIYPTNTPDQMKYILNESEAVVLFVDTDQRLKKLEGMSGLKHLKAIVTWDSVSTNPPSGIKLISRQEFLRNKMDEREAESLLSAIKPDDLSILLYTSGTTGEPKGVMLTHHNLVCDIRAMLGAVPQLTSDKVTMSFLPLSHIYERSLHHLMLLSGLKIYFAEGLDKLITNIAEVKPQVMVFVPRIFEKMYTSIFEKIKNAPNIRKRIFFLSLAIGKKTFDYRYNHRPLPLKWKILYEIADRIAFRKIRAVTGGRAELFISGGAPLSQEIAEFFFSTGFTILEGYGLSETCILSVNRPDRFKFGTVGIPFEGVEIKIADDGEILVRGPTIMKGYYHRPDATAEAIDQEGWFHSGDIGQFDSEGFLKITDRKKDLIVTAGGKKVAPQPVENAMKKDPLIENVCLIGDKKKYVVALLVPNLELCRSWAVSKGLKLESLEDCAKNEMLRQHFQKEFDRVNAELPKYSTIKDFRILAKNFSIETGELTPTLKLKRRVIQEMYHELIDQMYDQDAAELELEKSSSAGRP